MDILPIILSGTPDDIREELSTYFFALAHRVQVLKEFSAKIILIRAIRPENVKYMVDAVKGYALEILDNIIRLHDIKNCFIIEDVYTYETIIKYVNLIGEIDSDFFDNEQVIQFQKILDEIEDKE